MNHLYLFSIIDISNLRCAPALSLDRGSNQATGHKREELVCWYEDRHTLYLCDSASPRELSQPLAAEN